MSPKEIDVTTPSPARIYDYLLLGTENYLVDRQMAEKILERWPENRGLALDNRAWLRRVVAWLVAHGIDQFLDLGSGLPTAQNVHQVAQAIEPGTRVVYVDNDPIVLAHGRSLLEANDRTIYADADLRDADAVLAAARGHLDFTRPIALILAAVIHFVPERDDPAGLIARYADALPPGSAVALSHLAADGAKPELLEAIATNYPAMVVRSSEEIADLFGNLALVPPGLTDVQRWPEGDTECEPLRVFGAVARIS